MAVTVPSVDEMGERLASLARQKDLFTFPRPTSEVFQVGQRNAHECSHCRLFRDIIPRKELSIERHSLHLVDDVANGLICIAGYRQRPLTTLMDFQSKSFYLVGQDSNGIASDPKQPGEATALSKGNRNRSPAPPVPISRGHSQSIQFLSPGPG